MKYRGVYIRGFPRSGNHYLAALVNHNFYSGKDHTPHLVGAHDAFVADDICDDIFYIHIYRDFDDVAKSLFRMRHRFGLNTSSYYDFINTPLCDLWTDQLPVKVDVNVGGSTRVETGVDGLFSQVKISLFKHWWNFVDTYRSNTRHNLTNVKYSDLRNRLDAVMNFFARKIGSGRRSFVNIDQRVGWMPPGDTRISEV